MLRSSDLWSALFGPSKAARAGDAGKGFAVVAGEVKGLAAQTAHATDDIARTIARIDDIAGAVAAAVRDISRNIDRVAGKSRTVSGNISHVPQATADTGDAALRVRVRVRVREASASLAREAASLQREVTAFLDSVRVA